MQEDEDNVPSLRQLITGRNDLGTSLRPEERRVAMLYAAGMSMPAIAIQLGCDAERVKRIVLRSHVAKYLTTLTAAMVEEIAPVARNLTLEMESIASEALDRQVSVMRTLDVVGDKALDEANLKDGIRAKLGVLATTQDILDRAGKRAPTKTIGAVAHVVAPESLEKLERIITEAGQLARGSQGNE